MASRCFFIHALSPLHAGTGQAVGVIDLPIARERATGIPYLPGSSIKGVLREANSPLPPNGLAAFGPEPSHAGDHAGAVSIGDARLLLLPVRTLRGTFAWATSPLLLELARRDVPALQAVATPESADSWVKVTTASALRFHDNAKARVFVEDFDLTPSDDATDVDALARVLSCILFATPKNAPNPTFANRLAVVDDETMTFLWEHATQVDARNRLTPEGTVAAGALWYEESLPAETVLVGVASATKSRKADSQATAEELLDLAVTRRDLVQFGGKGSVGRGRARLVPIEPHRLTGGSEC